MDIFGTAKGLTGSRDDWDASFQKPPDWLQSAVTAKMAVLINKFPMWVASVK